MTDLKKKSLADDRRKSIALDEFEADRQAYLKTLDIRQRSGPFSLDPDWRDFA